MSDAACSEVYYKPKGYENKPWKNVEKDCYLIYEIAKKSRMGKDDIWVDIEQDEVKRLPAVMDIKKNKDLLNKEYSFCLKIMDELLGKANKVYDKQMKNCPSIVRFLLKI